ncbi:hypothetical protein BASA81_012559 [Batrachochytrium salamandrivorans]|nr:hypothetical protein BASA81_012559 [Batrachochytrium salamandrivorans]
MLRGSRRKPSVAVVVVGFMVLVGLYLIPTATTISQGDAHYFKSTLRFRVQALAVPNAERDEVMFSLSSPICKPDIAQVMRSATVLRKRCVQCKFAITLVVDSPRAEDSLAKSREVSSVFDRIVLVRRGTSLAQILLFQPTRPFVVYLSSLVISNHRFFPESLFDMLHKEYDLILPHRGSEATETIVGFVNSPAVRRVFALTSSDKRIAQVVAETALPDVKAWALSLEWACPVDADEWSEGNEIVGK